MRRTWAEYKRLQRRQNWLKSQLEHEQDLRSRIVDLEKRSQYLADLGTLQRDIQAFISNYGIGVKLVLNFEAAESGAGGAGFSTLLQHDRMLNDQARTLREHVNDSSIHMSEEERANLNVRLDAIEKAQQLITETLAELIEEVFPEKVSEA